MSSALNVEKIYMRIRPRQNTASVSFELRVYEIDDTLFAGNGSATVPTIGSSLGLATVGDLVWNSPSILGTAFGTPNDPNPHPNLEFTLGLGEQFTLAETSGSEGYLFLFVPTASPGGDIAEIDTTGSNSNPYTLGRSVIPSDQWGDVYLAFTGSEVSSVPEPSTYALGLLGLAGLGVVAWKRKRSIRA